MTIQQGTVISLIEVDGVVKGVKYRIDGEEELEVRAPLTIVCDGCFSNLRRTLCSSKVYRFILFMNIIYLENSAYICERF